jgi:chromosomal replication initiator protein
MLSTELWQEVQNALREQVAEQTYQTWFHPITQLAQDDGCLTVKVPSQFFYEWLKSHYGNLLESTLVDIAGRPMRLDYSIVLEENSPGPQPETFYQPETPEPRRNRAETFLNEQYSLKNFVEGPNNQFAKAAAEAVVHSTDTNLYNPLMVYGGVGLGKTHLLHAAGNAYQAQHPSRRVLYVSSEKFTLDFISAIKENSTTNFSQRYRKVDLLLVDDIQFFRGKERTQEEFFHTFNELYMGGKRIILSTDRPPAEIGLQKRLTSRFIAGLVVDIQKPDFETRVAILRQKAEESGIEIPFEVLEYLANHITSNVRQLQGALIRLLAYSSLAKSDINMTLAHKVLVDVMGKQMSPTVTQEDIIDTVVEAFDVKKNDIFGKGRRQEVALARQTAMFLAKELTHNSLKSIGLFFGGRDHSTVIHACRTVANRMEQDEIFNAEVKTLLRRLAGPIAHVEEVEE